MYKNFYLRRRQWFLSLMFCLGAAKYHNNNHVSLTQTLNTGNLLQVSINYMNKYNLTYAFHHSERND